MTNRSPSASCPSCGARASGKFCNHCGTSLEAGGCSQCGAVLPSGARFCSECGTTVPIGAANRGSAPSTSASVGSARGPLTYLPWAVAAVMLVAVTGYFLGAAASSGTPAMASEVAGGGAPFAGGAATGGTGGAPDISMMSPREKASRLYDRIMRYTEEGKKDSAQFFAPMALASFEMLGPELDLDARYDYGRVATETGSFDVAAAQADTILQKSPNHLLGLALVARIATLNGDAAIASTSWKVFLGARDSELKKALPEYQLHAADIEQATRMAKGGK